jgi:chromosome segregation ATPase
MDKKRKLEPNITSEQVDTLENQVLQYKQKEELYNKRIKILEEDIKSRSERQNVITSDLNFYIQKNNLYQLQLQEQDEALKASNDEWESKIQDISKLYREKSSAFSQQRRNINKLNQELTNYNIQYCMLESKYEFLKSENKSLYIELYKLRNSKSKIPHLISNNNIGQNNVPLTNNRGT